MMCIWLGVGMFLIVVAGVWLLVWARPSNLTFDKYAHLVDRGKITSGTEQQTVSSEKRFVAGEKEEREGKP